MTAMEAPPDFDDAMFGEESEPVETILDRDQANRILGRRARVARARERDEAIAKETVERVAGWLAHVLEKHDTELARLDGLLNHFHAAALALDPRALTIDLPYGVLKSRAVAESIEVVNEEDFIGWADVHRPDLVREKTTRSADRGEMKKALKVVESNAGLVVLDPALGEPVPGLIGRPATRNYSISVREDA